MKGNIDIEETTFERWWRTHGRHMSQYVSETIAETRKRIAYIAWLNGEYEAIRHIENLDPDHVEDVLQASIAEERRLKENRLVQYMNDGYGGMGEGDEGVPLNNQDQQP